MHAVSGIDPSVGSGIRESERKKEKKRSTSKKKSKARYMENVLEGNLQSPGGKGATK